MLASASLQSGNEFEAPGKSHESGFRYFTKFATFFAAAKFHVSRVCLSLICAALHAGVFYACPCTRGNEFEAPAKSHGSGFRKVAKFATFFAAAKFHVSRVCFTLICVALHASVLTACTFVCRNNFEAPGKSHESDFRFRIQQNLQLFSRPQNFMFRAFVWV